MENNKKEIIPQKSLVLLVGVPGIGKSTLAKNAFGEDSVIISSDAIREELYGDAFEQTDPEKVFEIFYQRIQENLKDGKRVIADATNIRKDSRERLYSIAKEQNVPVYALVFIAPLKTILKQNQMRDRKVPEYAIQREYKKMFGIRHPSEQEYYCNYATGERTPKYPLEKDSTYNQLSEELPKGHVIDILPSPKERTSKNYSDER